MHVSIEEVSPVEKKLAVEVEWPVVAAKLEAAYKELGKGVTLRGFRKGKVPRQMLERMFARQVEQEVAKELVQESFVRAAHQHQIQPVTEPIVDDVSLQRGAGFKYSARVEVKAQIDPTGYEGITLERPAPQVTVEEIDRALERKREDLAEYKKVEGRDALAATDVVVCKLEGEVAGKPFSRDGVMVDLGGGHEPLPGIAAALVGVPVAAKEHAITLSLPRAGGEGTDAAQLKVTIQDAREKSVPALDDDFAKDTGEADTLDDLRGKVREQLVREKERAAEHQLKSALVKQLLDRNKFEVAPSLVERQAEALVRRAKMTMLMQGVDLKATPVDENRMREELRPTAADEVRAAFLIEAIADKEKVEVSEADIEKRLAEMAQGRDTSVPRLKAELQKEHRFEGLKYQIREEKTLDLLLSRANITPSPDAASPTGK